MLEDVRFVVAILYALLIFLDVFLELSGRYASANIKIKSFPYFEDNSTIQACIYGIANTYIAYHSVYRTFYWFGVLYIAMGIMGIPAVQRLRLVLRPAATAQDET